MSYPYRAISSLLLILAISAHAQSTSQTREEQIVRKVYAKVSFLCSLHVVAKEALRLRPGTDNRSLETKIEDTTPTFILSDFRVGNIASIANEVWGDFVTVSPSGGEVLEISPVTFNLTEASGNHVSWQEFTARWEPTHYIPSAVLDSMMAKGVGEIAKLGGPTWTTSATYIGYAAYSVTANYQGKSTGKYKAMFFFGVDGKGNEVIAPQDFFITNSGLYLTTQNSAYPAGLLQSHLRETAAVTDWLQSNSKSSSLCAAVSGKRDVCCVDDKCGLSDAEMQSDLQKPIPTPDQ